MCLLYVSTDYKQMNRCNRHKRVIILNSSDMNRVSARTMTVIIKGTEIV